MNQDYVTQLRLQLREAALREERRAPLARRAVRVRRGLPGPAPLAAALAIALFALAMAIGVVQLRRNSEPVKPKVIHTIQVTDGLAAVSTGFGAVWASDSVSGRVLRIDPETRRVTARIDPSARSGERAVPAPPVEVMAVAGPDAVWALTGDLLTSGSTGAVDVVRIDPRTNRVVARIPVRAPNGDNLAPRALQRDEQHLWVIGEVGALRIDPESNAADRYVPYQQDGGAVADGDSLWTLLTPGRLQKLDAGTSDVVDDVQLDTPEFEHLLPGPRGVLTLAGATTMTLVDPSNGTFLWRADLGHVINTAWFDGDDLWAQAGNRLVRLDVDTGKVTGQISLHDAQVVGVERLGDSVWVAEAGGRIDEVR